MHRSSLFQFNFNNQDWTLLFVALYIQMRPLHMHAFKNRRMVRTLVARKCRSAVSSRVGWVAYRVNKKLWIAGSVFSNCVTTYERYRMAWFWLPASRDLWSYFSRAGIKFLGFRLGWRIHALTVS